MAICRQACPYNTLDGCKVKEYGGVYDIEKENRKFINGIIIPGYAPHDIEEWLQQPAEEGE